MNYLLEVLSFNKLLMTENLSTGQIALWYALMYINNMCGWKENFTVANAALNTYTHLSDKGIEKARNALIQKGLIRYRSKRNKAGVYTLLSIANSTEQSTEQNDSTPNSTEQSTDKSTEQSTEQSTDKSTALYKQNKTKQNKNTAATDDSAAEVFERYETLTGKTVSRTMESDINSFIGSGLSCDLISAVMDYSTDGGNGNWNYMRGTLENLSAEGIKTVDEWKQQRMKFKQRRRGGAKTQKSKFNNFENSEETDYDELEDKLFDMFMGTENA